MSSPLNMIWGDQTGGESSRIRNLRRIDSAKYNADFVNNMNALNGATDYMAQYLIVMQKGIDDANKNIIQKIQDFIADMIVIFTGGGTGDSGFEWGDLEYIIQALGDLFGFGDLIGDAADAVGHFFEFFLNPLEAFGNSVNSFIQTVFEFFADLLSNVPIIGDTLEEIVTNVAGGINDTTATAETAQETADDATAAVVVVDNKVEALLSGEVVTTITASGNWTKPTAPVTGWAKHTVYALAAGGGGRRGDPGTASGEDGGGPGTQGGYVIIPIADSVLPSTVLCLIGVAGVGATADNVDGGIGGETIFGALETYEVRAGGGKGGGLATQDHPDPGFGNQPQWNARGGYGRGGSASEYPNATDGKNGYLVLGGQSNQTGVGQDGGSPPSGKIGPGSGGGGGGRSGTTSGTGQRGGHGGAPGGGGGGGGTFSIGGTAGNGGNGAIGKMWVVSSPI